MCLSQGYCRIPDSFSEAENERKREWRNDTRELWCPCIGEEEEETCRLEIGEPQRLSEVGRARVNHGRGVEVLGLGGLSDDREGEKE